MGRKNACEPLFSTVSGYSRAAPKPRAEGSSPSAPAKTKTAFQAVFVLAQNGSTTRGTRSVPGETRSRRRGRREGARRSAAVEIARRSKAQKRFRAPQEGKQVLLPLPKQKPPFRRFLFWLRTGLPPEARGACRVRRATAAGGGGRERGEAQRSKSRAATRRKSDFGHRKRANKSFPAPASRIPPPRISSCFSSPGCDKMLLR